MTILARAFTAACAFAGAGWFGLWIYDTGWSSTYTPIVVAAVGGGLIVAALEASKQR